MSTTERNAIIEYVSITTNERAMIDVVIGLKYGDSSGQAFGGWALYLSKSYKNHKIESIAGHWIYRCMEIAGVEEWKHMVGRSLRVRQEHSKVHAIGHIIKDDWFCPDEEFAYMKGETE